MFLLTLSTVKAQQITVAGQPAELDIRAAGNHSIRVTLKPVSYKVDLPTNPALVGREHASAVIKHRTLNKTVKQPVGRLIVEVSSNPLTVNVTDTKGKPVQHIVFQKDGSISFGFVDKPVLGMGEGGPRPANDWKNKLIEFDRRGRFHEMQPRWQSDAYGTRNPVPMLIGTAGWGIFVASPWVKVDLRDKKQGLFIPWKPLAKDSISQNEKNQELENGKGLPPVNTIIAGFYDLFIFDAHNPSDLMKDISIISGQAVLPPKWALGYMQSHRTLKDEQQMIGIVDTFRARQIPIDAVIYLGTGFVSRGWNTKQPSFDANPQVFKRPLKAFIANIHERNVKVILHMVPYDRDKLPTLQGNIPAKPGEVTDETHIQNYWQKHVALMNDGADGFWPDEGDWFNLYERIKRHQLYYQGPVSTLPNTRPWSLHRNGYLGIAKWGGWVWSGDTESSWKTLEGQIAVGINHSLSLSPFWGSDIGGFYSTAETTGELYARWFQFGAFTASFRSHGRTWFSRLPWGWGLKETGPQENGPYPLIANLNNPLIEPVVKKYDELRYRLLSYNYTLTWQARTTGMPLMRAMWLQYSADKNVSNMGTQYMWGRDMLIAPVFEKGAASRHVYLPKGNWYDWWTNEKLTGGKTVIRQVDLSVMPIYIRAGAIIPFDPLRQYTSQYTDEPLTIKIYKGANGDYTLYEDDGISLDYLQGQATLTHITWNDKAKRLNIKPVRYGSAPEKQMSRIFKVELLPEKIIKTVSYSGLPVEAIF